MTALRIIALALALYVMWWTGPTAHRFARGTDNGIGWLRSAVFFLAAGTVAFQTFAVFGTPNDMTGRCR